jgi:hypothetical protein
MTLFSNIFVIPINHYHFFSYEISGCGVDTEMFRSDTLRYLRAGHIRSRHAPRAHLVAEDEPMDYGKKLI